MKKRLLVATVGLCLVSLILSSCGVSTSKYTEAVGERDVLKGQLETANVDLAAAEADLQSTKTQLQTAMAQGDNARQALQSANSELQSTSRLLSDANSKATQLQQSMARAKVLADLNATIFVPYMTGQTVTEAQSIAIYTSFTSKIATSGDAKLQGLFQACIDSSFSDTPMMNLFIYIFETLPQLLQTSNGGIKASWS